MVRKEIKYITYSYVNIVHPEMTGKEYSAMTQLPEWEFKTCKYRNLRDTSKILDCIIAVDLCGVFVFTLYSGFAGESNT